jgi:hypothetical protein
MHIFRHDVTGCRETQLKDHQNAFEFVLPDEEETTHFSCQTKHDAQQWTQAVLLALSTAVRFIFTVFPTVNRKSIQHPSIECRALSKFSMYYNPVAGNGRFPFALFPLMKSCCFINDEPIILALRAA